MATNATASSPPSNPLRLPFKRHARQTDPLIHYGRHYGRTVHALCNIHSIINEGLLRYGELADRADDTFTHEERRVHRLWDKLREFIPNLEDRVMEGSEEDVVYIATMIQRGMANARADDTKSLKGAVLDWLLPRGQILIPPLSKNIKSDRGFHHDRTGLLLCPSELDWNDISVKEKLRSGEILVTGDQWPLFLYEDYITDPSNPWSGLLRSQLLVYAFKHIFTSPSSVEREPKATKSGNARIHGMTNVTRGSIAYVATQVRFALSSSSVFSRSDTVTDSERFFESLLDLLEDVDETEEVNDLLMWWNRKVFPTYSAARAAIPQGGTLARIKKRREELRRQMDASNGH